jgi:hypothetical protein
MPPTPASRTVNGDPMTPVNPPGSHPTAAPNRGRGQRDRCSLMIVLSGSLSHLSALIGMHAPSGARGKRLSLSSCISCDNYELGDFETAVKPSRHRAPAIEPTVNSWTPLAEGAERPGLRRHRGAVAGTRGRSGYALAQSRCSQQGRGGDDAMSYGKASSSHVREALEMSGRAFGASSGHSGRPA